MSAEAQPKLSLRGVGKDYAGRAAVRKVDLDVEPGEFVTFLGPSGSGKTTTLRMIAGFIEPDRGSIVLEGRDLTRVPAYRREMGMVFQNYALFPHLTVAQNLAFPLRMQRTGAAEVARRVGTFLDLIQLSGHGDRRIEQLSGGQAQRVALARAMISEPSVLLMDEPLGALDKNLRESMQVEIMHLSRNAGATVVYVTHDQSEALAMSHRIAIYNDGAIEQLGTGRELYEEPVSLFVATFMGESNVLAGRTSGADVIVTEQGEQLRVSAASARRARLAQGSPAVVVVRPDRVRVVRPGPSADDRDRVSGEVRDVIYLGAIQRVLVTRPDGSVLSSESPSCDADPTLRPGDPVELAWRADAGVLLPRAKTSAEAEPRYAEEVSA